MGENSNELYLVSYALDFNPEAPLTVFRNIRELTHLIRNEMVEIFWAYEVTPGKAGGVGEKLSGDEVRRMVKDRGEQNEDRPPQPDHPVRNRIEDHAVAIVQTIRFFSELKEPKKIGLDYVIREVTSRLAKLVEARGEITSNINLASALGIFIDHAQRVIDDNLQTDEWKKLPIELSILRAVLC